MTPDKPIQGESKADFPFDRKIPNHNPKSPTVHVELEPRRKLHGFMTATAGNRYDWVYEEVRPLPYPPVLSRNVHADCSFACILLCHWAGVADPSGGNYDGYGNSTSLWEHLRHVAINLLSVGDFVVFGRNGSEHATMVLVPGIDPLLWSFGFQGAPNLYRLSADTRYPTGLRNPIQ